MSASITVSPSKHLPSECTLKTNMHEGATTHAQQYLKGSSASMVTTHGLMVVACNTTCQVRAAQDTLSVLCLMQWCFTQLMHQVLVIFVTDIAIELAKL